MRILAFTAIKMVKTLGGDRSRRLLFSSTTLRNDPDEIRCDESSASVDNTFHDASRVTLQEAAEFGFKVTDEIKETVAVDILAAAVAEGKAGLTPCLGATRAL